MEKKVYMKPQMEVIVLSRRPQLLAGSGVKAADATGVFDMGFGGTDVPGVVIPQ